MTHQDESLQVEILEELTSAVNYRRWLIGKSLGEIGSHPFELGSGSGVYAEEIIKEAVGIESYAASEVSSLSIEKLKNKFGNKDDKVIPNIEFKMRQKGYVGWSFMLFSS